MSRHPNEATPNANADAPAFVRFFPVLLIAYATNLGTVLVLIDHFRINRYTAQAFGVPTVYGSLLSRQQVFLIPKRVTRALKPASAAVAPSRSAAGFIRFFRH